MPSRVRFACLATFVQTASVLGTVDETHLHLLQLRAQFAHGMQEHEQGSATSVEAGASDAPGPLSDLLWAVNPFASEDSPDVSGLASSGRHSSGAEEDARSFADHVSPLPNASRKTHKSKRHSSRPTSMPISTPAALFNADAVSNRSDSNHTLMVADHTVQEVSEQVSELNRPSTDAEQNTNASTAHNAAESDIDRPPESMRVPDDLDQVPACRAGVKGCKSMCRWLKLTDEDTGNTDNEEGPQEHSPCPLIEMSLRASGHRQESGSKRVQCVIDKVRFNVQSEHVDKQMAALSGCIEGLSEDEQGRFRVALDLLHKSLRERELVAAARLNAARVETDMQSAVQLGEAALESKENIEASIEALRGVLHVSEGVAGNYLLDSAARARELLELLQPVPLVSGELGQSMTRARQALRLKSYHALMQAAVMLNESITEAEELELPVEEAKQVRQSLQNTTSTQEELQRALMRGAVALGSHNDVPGALGQLQRTLSAAQHQNLSDGLDWARRVVAKLSDIEEARKALQAASHRAQLTLQRKHDERTSLAVLDKAFDRAARLGLRRHGELDDAEYFLAQLQDRADARAGLLHAMRTGLDVTQNDTELSDEAEQRAIALLDEALAQAQGNLLEEGVEEARQLRVRLQMAVSGKEQMTNAIAKGTGSISAKTGEPEALHDLELALEEYHELDMTGGMDVAQKEMLVLKRMGEARRHLVAAMSMLDKSLLHGGNEGEAMSAVNASIKEAAKFALDAEVADASERLRAFEVFVTAQRTLKERLGRDKPQRKHLNVSAVHFRHATGVSVPNNMNNKTIEAEDFTDDNGSGDVDEHIDALTRSIESERRFGISDPHLEKVLRVLKNRKEAYAALLTNIGLAQAALNSRLDLVSVSINLSVSIQEAKECGLVFNMTDAEQLFLKLTHVQPAWDELLAAMIQGNISAETAADMQSALLRLDSAITQAQEFGLEDRVAEAQVLFAKLTELEAGLVNLKAAIAQGSIALRNEREEEMAMESLTTALHRADQLRLHKSMPAALELLHRLEHLNADHQKFQAAMVPAN